jgi:hypothetical protein
MRLCLFALASAISLLLCLSAGLLWVRSYGHLDEVDDNRYFVVDRDSADDVKTQLYGRFTNFMCQRGRVQFWQVRTLPASPGRPETLWTYSESDLRQTAFPDFPEAGHFGFSLQQATGANRRSIAFIFSLWAVVVATGIMPTLWGFKWWRRRIRPLPGHCRRCRYNLTGNASGICPECGTAVLSMG